MVRLRLLLYVLLVTAVGSLLVVGGGVVVLGSGIRTPGALWYIAIAFGSLLGVIALWKRERDGEAAS